MRPDGNYISKLGGGPTMSNIFIRHSKHITQSFFFFFSEFNRIPRNSPWTPLPCDCVLYVFKKVLELLFLFSLILSFLISICLYFIMQIKCMCFGLCAQTF